MKTSTKIWMCLAGAALVALGILCIIDKGATLLSLGWVAGLMLLIAGCSTFGVWSKIRHFLPQSGILFLTALMQICFGLFMCFHPITTAAALPYVFAFWALFEGVNIGINSFDFRKVGFRRWWLLLCLGILMSIFGGYSLVHPDLSANVIVVLVGVAVILDGIGYWIKVAGISRFEKFIKRLENGGFEYIKNKD